MSLQKALETLGKSVDFFLSILTTFFNASKIIMHFSSAVIPCPVPINAVQATCLETTERFLFLSNDIRGCV